ncbi:uncharacterized protein LOC103514764 [Diaphorina citri]|uniref:Uncharacterized protein LOC103514764 n=1 Tax=Diaphorina citri TaxID=121845 RepID=A0A3Q0J478_DIACI|nr:uncharacterized protein LOC103514764 [Diaphorina citri]
MPISQSVSMVKSHSSVYSNINGKVEGKAETKQELNKNGETYAKIRQNVEAKSVDNSPTPETNIITAVDIPGQGIHKVYRQRHPADITGNNLLNVLNILEPLHPKRNVEYSSVLDQAPVVDRSSNVQASPKDIAEYVFWTGDEKSVTSAIEDYMQAGLFSRSNEIPQAGLGSFPLNNLKRTTDFENTELNQIRQQLLKSNYNNYNKRTSSQIINNLAQSKYPSYQSKASESSNLYEKFSEEDYEELMEKLKVADLQYTEYSLEDIIYQLAKVMFAQSLSHGNSEAQDALQKFTSFLENEVDQGRISRTLEKKVIDILIASLSDTLNDHPEFLSAARGDNVHPRMSSLYNNGRSGVETSHSRNPLTSRLNPVYPMYSESGNGNPLSAPSQFESPGFSDKTANFDKNPLQSETYSRYFDKTSDFKEKNANLVVEDSGFTDKTLTFDNNPSQYDTNSRYLDKTSDFQQKNVVLLAKDPKFVYKTSSYQNNLGSDRNLGKSWTFSDKSADLAKDPSVLNSETSSNLGNKDPSLENDLAKETSAVEGPQISRETLRFPVASLLVEKRGVKKTIKRGAGFFAGYFILKMILGLFCLVGLMCLIFFCFCRR